MHNGRDCAHGRQVGKCDTCDLIDAEQRILELEAHVEDLLEAAQPIIDHYFNWMEVNEVDVTELTPDFQNVYCMMVDLNGKLRSTPEQCLAEVKAQAGRDGFIAGLFSEIHSPTTVWNREERADEYANQLRQQAAKGD